MNGSVVWVVWVGKALSAISRGLGGLEDAQVTFSSVPKHICLLEELHLLKKAGTTSHNSAATVVWPCSRIFL